MGLARFYHDKADMLTKKYDENNVLGTADFLAPEQAMDCHEVDTRADIYSLGATFYYLLTGQPPFPEGTVAQKLMAHQLQQPAPISQYRDDVPEELQAVVETMLAKSPDERYQQPIEVIAALSPWTETPIDVPPAQEMPKLSPLIAKMQQTSGPAVALSLSLSSMNLGRFGEGSSPSRSSGFPRPEPSSKSDSLRATLGSTSNRTGPLSATRPRPAPAPEPVPEPQEEVADQGAAENEAVEQSPGIDRQRLLIGVGVAGAVLFVCTFLGVLGVILLR
jgi:serine/threonine protein kinase